MTWVFDFTSLMSNLRVFETIYQTLKTRWRSVDSCLHQLHCLHHGVISVSGQVEAVELVEAEWSSYKNSRLRR